MQRWMNQGTTMRFNDIEKDIECCATYGFEAIELKYNLVCHYEPERVKELLVRNSVYAGSIGAVQLPILQDNISEGLMEEKFYSICQYADVLGAENIVAIPPRGRSDIDWGRIEEDAVKVVKRFADIAKEYQIKLALEIIGFYDSLINTIEKGLKLIARAKKDNLGIIYDLYHAMAMEDCGQTILKADPKDVFIVHVNDGKKCSPGKYQDDDRLWPGEGDIDIAKQISMIKSIGYKGPFSIEVYQPQMWSFDIQKCYKIAQDKMNVVSYLFSDREL